ENMAEEVWSCLEMYGLDEDRIMALGMDNASNNDTLMQHLAIKFHLKHVPFDPVLARIRCLPHTSHLAAIEVRSKKCCQYYTLIVSKLLKAIGAISEGRVHWSNSGITPKKGKRGFCRT
ncbi:hypothetical protein B0H11DRAFT_1704578, partial [Mycena galericulata]